MAIPANLKRKPFLAPIGLAALTWMVGVLALIVAAWLLITANSTIVVIVRHAEKVMDGSPDPGLTDQGQARAQLLARTFGDRQIKGHIDVIYTSSALRNRLTAAPLAAKLGIEPEVVSEDDPRSFAHQVLHEHRGAHVLVVGHSDTIPAIVEALSGVRDIAPIGASEYGTMYIVSVPRVGRPSVLSLSY
jgi:2,3-bisphosphoglycerate-dependent phosphoglycerate mutase